MAQETSVLKSTKFPEQKELPPPPFTMKELREAIPNHCFERSLITSFMHLTGDLIMLSILFYAASWIDYAPTWATYILWPIYWYAQGAIMTGLWVIGHECGHQAFSDYRSVNDTVGLIIHSLLLVPYHSWRISHGQHHKATAHMERDQVFVPSYKEETMHALNDSPLLNLSMIVVMWTVGWPGYLLFNVASQKHEKRANHFEPASPIFKSSHRDHIVVSDVALIFVVALFTWISYTYSFSFFVKYYFIPYLWTNFWLVTITYLQHTDIRIPHYKGEEWSFIRGALATVDRDYGVLNFFHHHIGDTHVAHHLFSTMPFYHAQEATLHLKKFLGSYYHYDNTPILKSLIHSWSNCHYVEREDGDVLFYKNNRMKKTQQIHKGAQRK